MSSIAILLLAVPASLAAVALLPGRPSTPGWTRALIAALCAFGCAIAAAIVVGIEGTIVERRLFSLPFSVRADVLTVVMLLLVTFIGTVILQFSRRYLDGDGAERRYIRWFCATLAAVTLLVVTNDLAVLTFAWIATSLALHQLLTHYPDRVPALIAAHKKFIASRVADLCLIGAVTLIGNAFGTFEMDRIFTALASMTTISPHLHWASVLLVASAALKCAQLPFHGWLIQVMEAPTPVSALLHAGVVNIGGFLMIRLAPLMTQSEIAQTLLVICGCTTAVIAALVMTTRVSIKVALAWSTCAQMGFMLLECGLGAYPLALLHIVAHSCYKAHSFLASGSVVERWRAESLRPSNGGLSLVNWIGALAIGTIAVTAAGALAGSSPSAEPALWALVSIVALGLTPFVVTSFAAGWVRVVVMALTAFVIAGAYFLWHAVFGALLTPAAPAMRDLLITCAAFGLLFAVQATLLTHPHGKLAHRLYPPLFAGLYLDELFTRFTFKVWPAKVVNQ